MRDDIVRQERFVQNVAVFYDDIFLEHSLSGHPESPRRLESIRSALAHAGIAGALDWTTFEPATRNDIALAHDPALYDRVQVVSKRGGGHFDMDTYITERSFDAAVHAAGAAKAAVDAVLSQGYTRAFALLRPPGHHATPTQAMGFCLFNNIALAARHAVRNYGLRRVLIIDWDVHHGNGTQDIFYTDPNVFFFSVHQQPLYPGTGHVHETGSGAGTNSIANVPLPAGVGDDVYMRVWDEILIPLLRLWQPQLVLLSAGFDAHWRDPLSDMRLSISGYSDLAVRLVEVVDELDAPLVAMLEGGYNLDAVSYGVIATIQAMRGDVLSMDPLGPAANLRPTPDVTPLLRHVRQMYHLL